MRPVPFLQSLPGSRENQRRASTRHSAARKIHIFFYLLLGLSSSLALAQEAGQPPAAISEGVISVQSDIAYLKPEPSDEYAKSQCKLDLYLPKTAPFPLLIWFHGGALQGGSKTGGNSVQVAKSLARQGIGVVLPEYRLNPKVKFPAYIEDAAQAVRWAINHAESLHAQPKVYVGGHSAGAYIAALLAMDEKYLKNAGVQPDQIAGFVAMSGQMMTHFTVAEERGLNPKVITADDAAPIHYIRNEIPPLLLLVGDNDWPARLEENQYFYAALKKISESKNVALFVIKDRDHGGILKKTAEAGDPAAKAILHFLKTASLPDDGSKPAAQPETSSAN